MGTVATSVSVGQLIVLYYRGGPGVPLRLRSIMHISIPKASPYLWESEFVYVVDILNSTYDNIWSIWFTGSEVGWKMELSSAAKS